MNLFEFDHLDPDFGADRPGPPLNAADLPPLNRRYARRRMFLYRDGDGPVLTLTEARAHVAQRLAELKSTNAQFSKRAPKDCYFPGED